MKTYAVTGLAMEGDDPRRGMKRWKDPEVELAWWVARTIDGKRRGR